MRALEPNFCRFGNFIGEPEESDVEEEVADDANQYLYDDEEPDADAEVNDQQLMEVDGETARSPARILQRS